MSDRKWDSHMGSHRGIAPATPYERTDGLTERVVGMGADLMSGNAREETPIRSLVKAADCKYCGGPIYLAICSDGKWRTFERNERPAAPLNVWAWRKRQGMQETDKAPGHGLHFCAQYHRFDPKGLEL